MEEPEMWPFYLYGRLIAVLEQGARVHGEVPWLEQYYPRGFFPAAGLREPLERHRNSVLNFLARQERAGLYLARLDWLASALSASEDEITFNTWASDYLSYDESRRPDVPGRSSPKAAQLYAQGYLDERRELQPKRPVLPQDENLWQFCWDYHQGRHLTFNIAGNSPNLPPGTQLGIADRRSPDAPAPGEQGRTPLTGGARCAGLAAGRPGRQRGCSQLIRTGPRGLTRALCSVGCSNGGASWRVNRFAPYPARLRGTNIHCRNWRWRNGVPGAELSATFFSEATGTGKNS